MKAIWRGRLYRALDTVGDDILLEGDVGEIRVSLGDPTLIVDPTDDEVRNVELDQEPVPQAESRDTDLRRG